MGKKSDHKCYSCGNTFTDLSYLKRHIKTIHDRQKKNTKLVILVGNPSLPQEIWDFTLIQYIKFRKIICVNFVKNRFRNQVHWKSVSKLFTIMTYTANFFQQNKYWTSTSTLLIRITKDTTKIDLCVHLDPNENTFLRWSYMSMK